MASFLGLQPDLLLKCLVVLAMGKEAGSGSTHENVLNP